MINAGDVISTQCLVSKGDLPIKITWTLNNRTLDSFKSISVSSINKRLSSLSIESVQEQHIGEFACVAENPVASVSYSTVLNINGTILKDASC